MPDLDLYNLKCGFERTNELLDLSRASTGISFLRHARRERGSRFTLIDPIDATLLRGVSFYDLFIDRRQWPALIQQGYAAATEALDELRRSAKPAPVRSKRPRAEVSA